MCRKFQSRRVNFKPEQGGHWYWNYWKILEYTGKIFHTGIILEKPDFFKKAEKLKNILELYWNFEILILENTGIFC